MTHEHAVAFAIAFFEARNRAFWKFWTGNGPEPRDEDYGYCQGWFQVGEHRIGAHEYAPGPTYSVD